MPNYEGSALAVPAAGGFDLLGYGWDIGNKSINSLPAHATVSGANIVSAEGAPSYDTRMSLRTKAAQRVGAPH